MKKIVSLFALMAMIFGSLAFIAPVANATEKEKVGICHRTGSDSNPYVYIEVPEDEANGHITGDSKQHNSKVTWKSDGVWNGVAHKDGDLKFDYYANEEDAATKCGERTPETPEEPPVDPEPPVCDDECKIPYVETNAPDVFKCYGVVSGEVLNKVVVPKGESCVLVDTHVNGSVVSWGGRNVTLADTTVRKNINLNGVTGDVTFGSKGHACRFDPYVGGSLTVKNSHNVLICQASVCDEIVVDNNDGKITVRDSSARKVTITNNNKYDADGKYVYRDKVIRVLNVDADEFVIKGNAPRKVVRR